MKSRCSLLYRPLWLLALIFLIRCDFAHDNDDIEVSKDEFRRATVIKKKDSSSFGRILTWNVKKLGACLKQDNIEQLKEAICTILLSANLVVLQEASNLDFSCLPCKKALKDEYQWKVDAGVSQDFKILVKTKVKKSFRVIKEGTCKVSPVLEPVVKNQQRTLNEESANNIQDVMNDKDKETLMSDKDKSIELKEANKLVGKLLDNYIQAKNETDTSSKNQSNTDKSSRNQSNAGTSLEDQSNTKNNDDQNKNSEDTKNILEEGKIKGKENNEENKLSEKDNSRISSDTDSTNGDVVKGNNSEDDGNKIKNNSENSNKVKGDTDNENNVKNSDDGNNKINSDAPKEIKSDADRQNNADIKPGVKNNKLKINSQQPDDGNDKINSDAPKEIKSDADRQNNADVKNKKLKINSQHEDLGSSNNDKNVNKQKFTTRLKNKSINDDTENNDKNVESDTDKSQKTKSTKMEAVNKENHGHKDDQKNSIVKDSENNRKEESDTPVILIKDSGKEQSNNKDSDSPVIFMNDSKENEQRSKDTGEKSKQTSQTGKIKDDNDNLSNRQKERFGASYNDVDEKSSQQSSTIETLKNRLLENKEKLLNVDTKSEQFKVIDNQLRFIETEITQLKVNSKPISRFHQNVNNDNDNHDNDNDNHNVKNIEGENPFEQKLSKRYKDERDFTEQTSEIAERPGNSEGRNHNSKKELLHDEEISEQTAKKRFSNKDSLTVNSKQNSFLKNYNLDSEEIRAIIHKVLAEGKYRGNRDKFVTQFLKSRKESPFDSEIMDKIRSYGRRLKRSKISITNNNNNNNNNALTSKNMKKRLKRNVQLYPQHPSSFKSTNQIRSNDKLTNHRSVKRNQVETVNNNIQDPTSSTKSSVTFNYELMSITSDLNSGNPFLLINVRLPKHKNTQFDCIEAIMSDVRNYNQDKRKVFIMGDFHLDRMSAADTAEGTQLYQTLANLQINGENFHSPITYHGKDPITTVYGRRYDNILTNHILRDSIKTIGPNFPESPTSLVLPLTLQRLYNNYITALYSTEDDESDSIYKCIKSYQEDGAKELKNSVCKDSWVPSSYISDHLPLEVTVKLTVKGKAAPVELRFASWSIQGETLQERLEDPIVNKKFVDAVKKYHAVIFNDYLPGDQSLVLQGIGGDIVRLKQGTLTTDFSIYINKFNKEETNEDDTEMFVMKKKSAQVTETDNNYLVSTVGLFTPSLVVDGESIKGCFYTERNNEGGMDFKKIMDAIDKDVKTRTDCHFKVLLASLYVDESFNLDKELYDNYKYINLNCNIVDGQKKYKYNVPRSRDLTDYVILLDKKPEVKFGDCTVGLPGDETKRGIEKLSDFEELSTHYPLSIIVKDKDLTVELIPKV